MKRQQKASRLRTNNGGGFKQKRKGKVKGNEKTIKLQHSSLFGETKED